VIARAVNFALFQAGWLVSVVAAAAGRPWIGPLAALAIVAGQAILARDRRGLVATVVAVAAFGTALDTLLRWAGITSFAGWPASPWPCPPWITGLWALYAGTLSSSMAWLQGRPVAAAALGAACGPLSYAAAERLGAVALADDPWLTWGGLALAWAIAVPLTLGIARLSGRSSRTAGGAR